MGSDENTPAAPQPSPTSEPATPAPKAVPPTPQLQPESPGLRPSPFAGNPKLTETVEKALKPEEVRKLRPEEHK